MAYELIPGVRQDHRGRAYQLGRYPNGKLVEVPATLVPLSEATLAALTPVEVESQTKQGEFYRSLACYQGRTI